MEQQDIIQLMYNVLKLTIFNKIEDQVFFSHHLLGIKLNTQNLST